MTSTAPKPYLLVKYGPDTRVSEHATYDEALAAYEAVTADDDELHVKALAYAVRNANEPRWANAPWTTDNAAGRVAYNAGREFVRRELGATALNAVKTAEPGCWLDTVEKRVMTSMVERGYQPTRADVSDAVKARVVLGRCRPERYRSWEGHPLSKQGYWFPKSEGPLHKHECPLCGNRLGQSTLAFGAGFRRPEVQA